MTALQDAFATALYHQAEDYFFASISRVSRHWSEGLSAYSTGVESSSLNLLFVPAPGVEQVGALLEGIRYLETTNAPFCVVLRHEGADALVSTLVQQGFLSSENTTAMALDLKGYETRTDTVQQVRCTDDNLDDWAAPVLSAFGSPPTDSGQYQAQHQAALDAGKSLRHLTLYVDQTPVCALTLSLHQGVARLDDIGTDARFQGKGYATALIHHALAYARHHGASACFLEASLEGASIYRKAGFRDMFEYRAFFRE